MLTDLLLLAVPIPLLLSAKITWMQYVSPPKLPSLPPTNNSSRLRLLFLFSLGGFLIAISVVRMMQGFGSTLQVSRTMWASIEIFFAVFVAVSPTIYALCHSKGSGSTNYPSRTQGGGTWVKGTVMSALKTKGGEKRAVEEEDVEMKGGIMVTRTLRTERGSEEELVREDGFRF